MDRRGMLRERYEDAYFAVLMDALAQREGEKALAENERLRNDPSAAVPGEVSARCERTIRRHFAARDAKVAGRAAVRAFGKVAMVAGVLAMLFTGAFAASETVRVGVLNFVAETFDTHTEFRFSEQAPEEPGIRAGWLPEGFVLEESGSNGTKCWYTYTQPPNGYLYIFYMLSSESNSLGLDTEDASVQTVSINGTDATLIEKDCRIQILWIEPSKNICIHILSENINSSEVIRIAENLDY